MRVIGDYLDNILHISLHFNGLHEYFTTLRKSHLGSYGYMACCSSLIVGTCIRSPYTAGQLTALAVYYWD